MRSTFLKMTSAMTLGAILLVSGGMSNATPLSVSGTICTNFNAGQAQDLDYFTSGVRTISANPTTVVCALPRQPVPSGFNSLSFTFSGSNATGSTTSGSLNSFNQSGGFLGSASFSSGALSYLISVTLPIAQLPTLGFTSVLVSLPGNAGGVYRGTTINM
jgi:hypothetical protein